MLGNRQRFHLFLVAFAILGALGGLVWAASKAVDLDANGTTESTCALNILSTFPAKVENVVTNKAVGDAFTFNWFSAGPGGFKGSVGTGTSTGVGSKWTWQTSQAIYSFTGNSCTNDICFTATAGLPVGTSRGPFSVPGRSLTTSGVTLSNTSLTSSLISFFSPPKVLFSATSSVGQPGSDQVSYTTTLSNTSLNDLTVHLDAGPPGCCPHENQLNCSGTCVDYLTDENNCGGCGIQCDTLHGQICSGGTCLSVCPLGQTLCQGECVDTTVDPLNCGGCGHACGTNQICTNSTCITCTSPLQTACSNKCVNLHTDPLNCGACGVNCNNLCPSTGQGACSQGNSCFCVTRNSSAASFTAPTITSLPPPAPVCETQASTQTIPAGTSQTLPCNAATFLAKEVLSIARVCDGSGSPDANGICPNGLPASEGPFIQLVPDGNHPVSGVAVSLSPTGVSLKEPSGNGLWEPGETAQINVFVGNAGFATIVGGCATLSSAPQDITPEDGISNPTSVNITTATACYPDIPGTPTTSTGCTTTPAVSPVGTLTPFVVSVPSGYLGDTSRLFILHFTGTANGAPISEDVPLTLGIAGSCDPTNVQGNYDGLVGLDLPMAALKPDDDPRPLPFPPKPFTIGKTRPMKLSMSCGGLNLDDSLAIAPQIVSLLDLNTGKFVDLNSVAINDSPPNPFSPLFRFENKLGGWIFNLRTKGLSATRYRIGIQIAGRKTYFTGVAFVN